MIKIYFLAGFGTTIVLDLPAYMHSLEILRDFVEKCNNPKLCFFPAHGDVITDPIGKIDEYKSFRMKHIHKVSENTTYIKVLYSVYVKVILHEPLRHGFTMLVMTTKISGLVYKSWDSRLLIQRADFRFSFIHFFSRQDARSADINNFRVYVSSGI